MSIGENVVVTFDCDFPEESQYRCDDCPDLAKAVKNKFDWQYDINGKLFSLKEIIRPSPEPVKDTGDLFNRNESWVKYVFERVA